MPRRRRLGFGWYFVVTVVRGEMPEGTRVLKVGGCWGGCMQHICLVILRPYKYLSYHSFFLFCFSPVEEGKTCRLFL